MITEENPWDELVDLCPDWAKHKNDVLFNYKNEIEKIIHSNCMLLTSFFVYPIAFTYERYSSYFKHGDAILANNLTVRDYSSWIVGLNEYFKFLKSHLDDFQKMAEHGIIAYDLGLIIVSVENEDLTSSLDKFSITEEQRNNISTSFNKCLKTMRGMLEMVNVLYEQIDFNVLAALDSHKMNEQIVQSDPGMYRIHVAISEANENILSFFALSFKSIESIYRAGYNIQTENLDNYRNMIGYLSTNKQVEVKTLLTNMFSTWVEFTSEIISTKISPNSEDSYTWIELLEYTANILSQLSHGENKIQ